MIADFIRENYSIIIWLSSISFIVFVGTILIIPIIFIRIPADYFVKEERKFPFERKNPFIGAFVLIIKNMLGFIFLIAGFIMLFTPGQGILTIFIGISLINFPGKRKLERKLIFHPKVLPVVNAIRKKAGKQPLIM